VPLGGEIGPSGGQNEQKGFAKAASLHFYHVHWPRRLMRRLSCHRGRILSLASHTKPAVVRPPSLFRERVHCICPPFSKCTDRGNTEGSVRRGTRVSPP
jgi:hypothetical protein